MKFSRQNKYVLLCLLVALNIIMRIPILTHEIGVDSFYIHALATMISSFGYAGWIIHPTSFFGLYPYSYASAHPFLLSGLSQASGISIEYVILIVCIFLGVFGAISFWVLAKEIVNDDLYAFLAAFIYSLSPNFMRFTYWEASTRSLFMALLPFILWLMIRYGYTLKKEYLFILVVSIFLALATHRVSLLLPIIIFAFILSFVLHNIKKVERYMPVEESTKLNAYLSYFLLISGGFLFLIQFTELSIIDLDDYHSGFFFTGTDFISVFLNMAADYTSKIGIFLFFAIGGLITLIFKNRKSFGELFTVLSFTMLLLFMGLENYSPLIFAPILILLLTFGLIIMINNLGKWKSAASFAIFFCIITSIGFTVLMMDHWRMYEDTLSDETVAAAFFIKERSNGTVVANTGDLASKMTSFSAVPTIPLGGPYAHYAPPGQIAYGFVNSEQLNIKPIQISEIRPSTDTFYIATNAPNAKNEWVTIMQGSYWHDSTRNMLSKYKANLIIEIGESGKFLYWSNRYSNMLVSLYDSGNKIYSNAHTNIYSVNY